MRVECSDKSKTKWLGSYENPLRLSRLPSLYHNIPIPGLETDGWKGLIILWKSGRIPWLTLGYTDSMVISRTLLRARMCIIDDQRKSLQVSFASSYIEEQRSLHTSRFLGEHKGKQCVFMICKHIGGWEYLSASLYISSAVNALKIPLHEMSPKQRGQIFRTLV